MPDRPDLTRDPLADRLGRFTPDTSGLDRAELLFQAGRASVGGQRLWPALAGLLALSHAVTLVVMLSPAGASRPVVTPPAQPAEPVAPALAPPGPVSPERDLGIVRAWPPVGDPDIGYVVQTVDQIVPAGPPLDALAIRAGLRDRASPKPFRFD